MRRQFGYACAAALGLITACGQTSPAPEGAAEHAQSPAVSAQAAPAAEAQETVPVHTISTGKPVVSIAAIPATAHLGVSQIVAAHGEQGATIYDARGAVLATIDTPARLVAHYQGLLVIYYADDAGVTRLTRYRIDAAGGVEEVEMTSPSPIAATTLQRTAIATLGPAQIDGSDLVVGERVYSAPVTISAVAAASYFPPLVAGKTLLLATEAGDIHIQAAK